ncbi:MAG: molybdenum cofactor biosynthesis protein MoaE [Planctomycetota bacterium]|nr:molybdenum cofactor biosynthesis protein MoaE [Planctomycetota bacterium]
MASDSTQYHAELVSSTIDVSEQTAWLADPGCGAVLVFCGNVRDSNQGQAVTRIEYQAYESMALSQLREVAKSLLDAGATRALAVHRLGMLEVGETSILLGISLPHRKDGFQLLERGMEQIKTTVPIWKHEHYVDGNVAWIEGS